MLSCGVDNGSQIYASLLLIGKTASPPWEGRLALSSPFRILANNDNIFNNVCLSSTQIFGNLFACHHDETVYPDPWEFKPDRFLEEGKLVGADHPAVRKYVWPYHFIFLLHWYYFEIWLCRVFIYKYFQICVFYILVLLDLASGGGGAWVSKWLESECSCTPRVCCRNLKSRSQKIRHFRHMTQERYFRSPLWFYRHLCSIVLLSVERECSRSQSPETGCEWKLLVMYNTWLVYCFYLLEIWCYLLKSRK